MKLKQISIFISYLKLKKKYQPKDRGQNKKQKEPKGQT